MQRAENRRNVEDFLAIEKTSDHHTPGLRRDTEKRSRSDGG